MYTLHCGGFSVPLHNVASYAGATIGAALSCKRMQNRLWGMLSAPALFGGNWNNTLLCGGFYVNLNNTASNANTNNGAAHLILMKVSI